MALPSSGNAISLGDIQTEFGGSNPISMSEYYRNGAYVTSNNTGVPTSGQISLNQFYGTRFQVQFNSASNTQTFNSSGTWSKPGSGTAAVIQLWGAGGPGGGGNWDWGGSGGGGGAYVLDVMYLSSMSGSYSVTIGSSGGRSRFGSLFYAGAGASGAYASSNGGGGGGGQNSGSGTTRGTASPNYTSQYNDDTLRSILDSNNPSLLGQTGGNGSGGSGGRYGGGGGGGNWSPNVSGGGSTYGGGGGGGAGGTGVYNRYGTSGGSSTYGGNGGAGGRAGGGGGANGSQPAGGGGGGAYGSGYSGGKGKCIVKVY